MKRRSVRILLFTLVPLLLIVGVLSLLTYLQMRQDRLNRTLIAALKAEDYPAALRALQQGADARTRDYPPDTRSFWRRLLDRLKGKSPKASADATTALDLLIEGPPKWLDEHIQSGAKTDPPSLHDWEATLKALLKGGADPNAIHDLFTHIELLLSTYPLETLRTLLAYGFRIDVHSLGADDWLWQSVVNPNPGVTEFLLDRGMNPNTTMGMGGPPVLIEAVRQGNFDAVKALLDHGASALAKAMDGDTALDEAVENQRAVSHIEPILLLKGMPPIKSGGDPDNLDAIIALLKANGATSHKGH